MKLFFTIVLSTLYFSASAQYDTLYMAVAPFNSTSKKGQDFAKKARAQVLSAVNADYRMFRVDRDEASAVRWEREFQKSEDFIDGKIVDQGKSIGADYVIDGHYDYGTKQLRMAIYEVNTGNLKCSAIVTERGGKQKKDVLDIIFLNFEWDEPSLYPPNSTVKASIEELFESCFPDKSWAVLRPVAENKNKVKEMLVAAGSRMGLRKGKKIEILVVNTENVDGIQLKRLESAGWGKIVEVESDNFSIVKLEAGEKNIKNLLAEGKKLRCRTFKK